MTAAEIQVTVAEDAAGAPVIVGVRTIRIRELTVAEVRKWLQETAAQTWRDPIHATALYEVGLDELARMSDLSAEDFETFAPSQLSEVVRVARRLNPHFFRLRDALMQASRRTGNESSDPPSAIADSELAQT